MMQSHRSKENIPDASNRYKRGEALGKEGETGVWLYSHGGLKVTGMGMDFGVKS